MVNSSNAYECSFLTREFGVPEAATLAAKLRIICCLLPNNAILTPNAAESSMLISPVISI